MRLPVIAIFDIGKTNKKLVLFDDQYKIVFEQMVEFDEGIDEDGDPCEDIARLSSWIKEYLYIITASDKFEVKAINVSAYGASLVHMDSEGTVLTPLYNYLKPYPQEIQQAFYLAYGEKDSFSLQTASAALGNLNSGLQLYRIKQQRPELFARIAYSLHLPHFISWLITGKYYSDITSVGCHTALWDFNEKKYHHWATLEKIDKKMAPFYSAEDVIPITLNGIQLVAGVGLHDSSAALIPYLSNPTEPFLLLSTGTWCISLNPFNNTPLTSEELTKDCLCYLDYKGKPVKASRLFSGNEHEKQINLLAEHFLVQHDHYKRIKYNPELIAKLKKEHALEEQTDDEDLTFAQQDYSRYKTYEEAYHKLILNLVKKQVVSTNLVLTSSIKRIYVDGGFSKNSIFMNLVAAAFPQYDVFAASVAQATALGAAIVIHSHWNKKSLPSDLITLTPYKVTQILEI